MVISDEMKRLVTMKHRPPAPSLSYGPITTEKVEAFLVDADSVNSLKAYEYLILEEGGRNFTIVAHWISTYDENGVGYQLVLTLTVLKGGDREDPKVEITRGTPLWDDVITASEIKETDINIPYPGPTFA